MHDVRNSLGCVYNSMWIVDVIHEQYYILNVYVYVYVYVYVSTLN